MQLKDSLLVLLGLKVAVDTKTLNEIYTLTPMNQETKDKLEAVKTYLTGLPAKFLALQGQIDALKSNDAEDAAKIADLTGQVDSLKAEHDEIVTVSDELDAAAKAADAADGE